MGSQAETTESPAARAHAELGDARILTWLRRQPNESASLRELLRAGVFPKTWNVEEVRGYLHALEKSDLGIYMAEERKRSGQTSTIVQLSRKPRELSDGPDERPKRLDDDGIVVCEDCKMTYLPRYDARQHKSYHDDVMKGPKTKDFHQGLLIQEGPDVLAWPSPGYRAASVYRRECGWDFTPHGLEICSSRLTVIKDGRIIAFALLYGTYLAHLWVAKNHRRQRRAAKLLAWCELHGGELSGCEGPLTDDGRAFIRATRPEWLKTKTGIQARRDNDG